MPVTAFELIEDRPFPTTVHPDSPLSETLILMSDNDFTSLPVVLEDNSIVGIVTSDSVLQTIRHVGVLPDELRVRTAMDSAKTFLLDEELSELLEALTNNPCVLVTERENKLLGIITSWDTSEYFRLRSEDIMFIKEIEIALKEHIRSAFTDRQSGVVNGEKLAFAIAEVVSTKLSKAAREAIHRYFSIDDNVPKEPNKQALEQTLIILRENSHTKKLDDLTLYDLIQLLFHKYVWSEYQTTFLIPDDRIRGLLEAVGDIRNDVAHFRTEITRQKREQLRYCSRLLHELHPPREYVIDILVEEDEILEDEVLPTEEELDPRDSRYAKLANYLRNLKIKKVRMNFDQIEEIIDGDLPPSARIHRAWWANDSVSHRQSIEWLEAGWRMANVNFTSEEVTFARVRERELAYIDFFTKLMGNLRERAEFTVRNSIPMGVSWINILNLPRGGRGQPAVLTYSFTRDKRFRVELYIDTLDQSKNKKMFDLLYGQKEDIEAEIGDQLAWERLDSKRASRIAYYLHGVDIENNEKYLQEVREWAVNAMINMERAIADRAEKALKEVL